MRDNTYKELIRRIRSGETTWEESGLLKGLTDIEKVEVKKLFDIGIDIASNESDSEIRTLILPCIRRIYSGLYSWSINSQIYRETCTGDCTGLPFIFANPDDIHNMLITKYKVLKKGMSVLATTDIDAEACSLLCDDYIRSVKELVRKDIGAVKKVINREMLLSELLG
jgi:hypothetical protein